MPIGVLPMIHSLDVLAKTQPDPSGLGPKNTASLIYVQKYHGIANPMDRNMKPSRTLSMTTAMERGYISQFLGISQGNYF
jgi:hypothetical protein